MFGQTSVKLPVNKSVHLAPHAWILEDMNNELELTEILNWPSLRNAENAFQSESDIPFMDLQHLPFGWN